MYHSAFITHSQMPVDILSYAGPDPSFHSISKFVHKESETAFDDAMLLHRQRQGELLADVTIDIRAANANSRFCTQAHSAEIAGDLIEYDGYVNCPHKADPIIQSETVARLSLACRQCRKMYTLAAYFTFHPEEVCQLLTDDSSSRLTSFGVEAQRYCQADETELRETWWESARFGKDWWRLELGKQGYIDARR